MKLLTALLIQSFIFAFTANITKIKGDVFLNGNQIRHVSAVNVGDIIEAKGKKSLFVVKYSNGTKYMVRNGKIKIDKMLKTKTSINLILGEIFSSVNKKAKQSFDIKTKTAALGVRGTEFFVSEKPGDTYLCVCDGQVSAKNESGEVLVSKKEDLHIKKSNKLEIQKANKMMWEMATDGFKELNSY